MPMERSRRESKPPPNLEAYVTDIPNMHSSVNAVGVGEATSLPQAPSILAQGDATTVINNKGEIRVNEQCLDSASVANGIACVSVGEGVLDKNLVINEVNKTLPTAAAVTSTAAATASAASEKHIMGDLSPVIANGSEIEKK